jgi:hypothetical protein
MNAPGKALKAETSTTTTTTTRWSLVIYLGLMVYVVLVKILLDLGVVKVAVPTQANLLGWPMIGFLTIAGGLSVWLGPRARLPQLWDPDRSPRQWLLLPAIAGLGLGAVNLTLNAFTGQARLMAEAVGVSSINAPFPGSIMFYSGGAIVIESLYRLILLTLPLWLIANLILRKRGYVAVFWVVALLTSLLETSDQMGFVSSNPGLMVANGLLVYAMNLFEAFLFWRYGFLAPLVFRIGFYMVWHVMAGVMGV